MTDEFDDGPLLENTDPARARPLPEALIRARADVLAAAQDVLAVPEGALPDPWSWTGESEADIRYGAYRAAEALEVAEIDARRMVASRDANERRTALILGPTTAARWDLQAILLALDDARLDADPGGGEWSIRLVLGHIIGTHRGYASGNAWIQRHGTDAREPVRIPDGFWETLPDDETTEAAGSLEQLRMRLDAIVDLAAVRLAGTADERLDIPCRWAGFPVTLGFRFGRMSSHLREHTIQLEKTFALLGHVPDERARLVRNLLSAYGRAESAVFGRHDVDTPADRIAEAAAEARAATQSARMAAGA